MGNLDCGFAVRICRGGMQRPFDGFESGKRGDCEQADVGGGRFDVTLTASVTNDTADEGVTWTIAPASGAGTISSTTTTSVIYTAPATPPAIELRDNYGDVRGGHDEERIR